LPHQWKIEYFRTRYARLSQRSVIEGLGVAGQGMRWIITIVAGLLASGSLFAPHGLARAATDPLKAIEDFNKKNPPIVFFIAKGGPDACGPGCDSWIAGDGRFDDDAAARLRKVLNQVGKRKLPIYLQSPGGNIMQAMAVGRLLRSR
jgi:hypothetical protein